MHLLLYIIVFFMPDSGVLDRSFLVLWGSCVYGQEWALFKRIVGVLLYYSSLFGIFFCCRTVASAPVLVIVSYTQESTLQNMCTEYSVVRYIYQSSIVVKALKLLTACPRGE